MKNFITSVILIAVGLLALATTPVMAGTTTQCSQFDGIYSCYLVPIGDTSSIVERPGFGPGDPLLPMDSSVETKISTPSERPSAQALAAVAEAEARAKAGAKQWWIDNGYERVSFSEFFSNIFGGK